MNDGGDCRTAPATPGLLKSRKQKYSVVAIVRDRTKNKSLCVARDI